MITLDPISTEPNEVTNAKILAISEDLLEGFQERRFHQIAQQTGLPLEVVLEQHR